MPNLEEPTQEELTKQLELFAKLKEQTKEKRDRIWAERRAKSQATMTGTDRCAMCRSTEPSFGTRGVRLRYECEDCPDFIPEGKKKRRR